MKRSGIDLDLEESLEQHAAYIPAKLIQDKALEKEI
jgi:hypothetical protein